MYVTHLLIVSEYAEQKLELILEIFSNLDRDEEDWKSLESQKNVTKAFGSMKIQIRKLLLKQLLKLGIHTVNTLTTALDFQHLERRKKLTSS